MGAKVLGLKVASRLRNDFEIEELELYVRCVHDVKHFLIQ
jgi:hypothetical protein